MAFRVKVTPQAKQDANAILAWLISQEAGEAELRWFRRLDAAIYSRFPRENSAHSLDKPKKPLSIKDKTQLRKAH